jgi:5'-3' exonuclease
MTAEEALKLLRKWLRMSSKRPKVALIDADFLAYSTGFTTEDEPVEIAKSRLTEWLTDIVYMDLKCDDYVSFTTGPGNFRYEVATTVPYKGNRKDAPKPKHLGALKEHLKRLGAVEVQGIEADDAVAIELYNKGIEHYWIVHTDKDLNQLPGWHYNPMKCIEYYVDQESADRSFWTQVLMGDRVDAIPGLAGIGPKKAEKILKDCHSYADMEAASWEAYKDKGHGVEYFTEQSTLLWLQRYEGQRWSPKLNGEMWTPAESTLTKPPEGVSEDNSVPSKLD